MGDDFQFDVFLSHSTRDKEIVRPLPERLRKDGLRVWFDEWEIRPGDSIPSKIESGLEHSRVLVLCMSAQAFGSDWAQLESGTFRFRDPLNKDRRFIPLRLDDAPIKGSLAQFLYVNWLSAGREQGYAHLLDACRPTPRSKAIIDDAVEHFAEKVIHLNLGDNLNVLAYAFSADGKRILSGGLYGAVQLWDGRTGEWVRECPGHAEDMNCVVSNADNRRALTTLSIRPRNLRKFTRF